MDPAVLGWINLFLLLGLLALALSANFKLFYMATVLDELKAAVTQSETVTQSAIVLLQGLKQKLDDAIASGDPAQLHALSAEIGQNTQALADAVTANTPA